MQWYTDSSQVQCLAVESETAGLERETQAFDIDAETISQQRSVKTKTTRIVNNKATSSEAVMSPRATAMEKRRIDGKQNNSLTFWISLRR
jgi:hypothetical protein